MIYSEREAVRHPYSSLFKGYMKSAIKRQYELSAIVPWQSDRIGYGHPRQSAFQKKPQGGVCLCAYYCDCITAAELCPGISLVDEDYIRGDYVEILATEIDSAARCVLGRHNPNHSTQHFPAPLTLILRKVVTLMWNVNTTAQEHCLFYQFSVTPMVCWQQIGCYKMALSELRYKCMNGLHVKGMGERCVSSDERTTILCSLQQSSVQNGTLDYKITLDKALWCWALRTETSSRDDRAGTKQAVDQTVMTYQGGMFIKDFQICC